MLTHYLRDPPTCLRRGVDFRLSFFTRTSASLAANAAASAVKKALAVSFKRFRTNSIGMERAPEAKSCVFLIVVMPIDPTANIQGDSSQEALCPTFCMGLDLCKHRDHACRLHPTQPHRSTPSVFLERSLDSPAERILRLSQRTASYRLSRWHRPRRIRRQ